MIGYLWLKILRKGYWILYAPLTYLPTPWAIFQRHRRMYKEKVGTGNQGENFLSLFSVRVSVLRVLCNMLIFRCWYYRGVSFHAIGNITIGWYWGHHIICMRHFLLLSLSSSKFNPNTDWFGFSRATKPGQTEFFSFDWYLFVGIGVWYSMLCFGKIGNRSIMSVKSVKPPLLLGRSRSFLIESSDVPFYFLFKPQRTRVSWLNVGSIPSESLMTPGYP
jgi:hypothetical protein